MEPKPKTPRGRRPKTVRLSTPRRNRRLAQKRRFNNQSSLLVTSNDVAGTSSASGLQEETAVVVVESQQVEETYLDAISSENNVPSVAASGFQEETAVVVVESAQVEAVAVEVEENCMESYSSGNEFVFEEETKTERNCHLEGRRLVAIGYFLEQILSAERHAPFDCNITDMYVVNETKSGLFSIITLKCQLCNTTRHLRTDYEHATELQVNDAATVGIISSGIGFSTAREVMSVLNVPFMSFSTFTKCHDKVADKIHETLWKQIEDNVNEEAHLARLQGDVDADETPTITVIADGAWSKRSYNVNYNALSGVACIIGQRTGKVLYVAIKNKYCCICARSEKKGITSPDHTCYKNFEGPSTAMEAALIVDGFKFIWETYGVKFTRLVGDGDSSVHKRLLETRPYGPCIVEKVECTNHLLRNMSKHLREIEKRKRSNAKNLPVSPELRKIVSSRSYRLIAAIKKAVQYRRSQKVSLQEQIFLLIKDLKNAPSHVFGEHEKCKEIGYFNCTVEEGEVNHVCAMKQCGLYDDVLMCFQRLIDNAYSLILNMTNNAAEHYNSTVAKFVGGKRINYSQRRQFITRAEASAVSYNSRSDYYRVLHKQMVDKSPSGVLKKYITKLKKRQDYAKKIKLFKKQLFPKKSRPALPDEHYGATTTEHVPDLTSEEYAKKENVFLDKLRKDSEQIKKIEELTRGQADNPIWFHERANRITASNFKAICSLQKKTSCVNTVKKLLYSNFTGNASTRYGRQNELRAIHEFQRQYNLEVKHCGFFIDVENYMLGASPDGIVTGPDGVQMLVEIKCPANSEKFAPQDAIRQKIIRFAVLEDNKLKLKQNHAYYFQVQGQLQVTNTSMCYFVIWTPLGILVEEIKRDTRFWKDKMENKLISFFYKCLLPEIVDSRQSRNMDIRNPPRE